MLKAILTRLLNHLIAQNSWARSDLRPFGGKSVTVRLLPAQATLTILEGGGMAAAGETAEADAIITLTLPTALRLLAGDHAASTLVTLEGDTALAAAFSRVLQNLRWEYEEDLSRVVGDIPAHKIGELARHAASEMKKQSLNAAEMLVEYWQEEDPLIAKKRHVQQFMQETDGLRDDVALLEKRLEKLAERLASLTVDRAAPANE